MPPRGPADAPFIENPTAADYASAAEHYLRTKDLVRAAEQVAAGLTFDPNDEGMLVLLERIASASKTPLLLAPDGQGVFFGLVAVRGRLFARVGRVAEALNRIFSAVVFRPAIPYLAWGRAWVAKRREARKVDPSSLAAWITRLLEAARGVDWEDGLIENMESAADIAEAVIAAAPSPALVAVRARVLSALGRDEEARSALRANMAVGATWEVASTLGALLLREGDPESAAQLFKEAIALRPQEIATRVDLGDALLTGGRLGEAESAYSEALVLDPAHDWALASRAFARALSDDDAGAKAELQALSEKGGDGSRATALLRDLQAYVTYMPVPDDDVANVVRSALSRAVREGGSLPIRVKIRAKRPEMPSVHLAFSLGLGQIGRTGSLTVTSETASLDSGGPLWKKASFQGGDAAGAGWIPALAAPPESVSRVVESLARTPFDAAYRTTARSLASGLTVEERAALPAAMVNPPALPADVDPVAWVMACQLAAAMLFAEAGPDSEWQSEATRSLISILEGPEDWSVAAACVALGDIAARDEASRSEARTALDRLSRREAVTSAGVVARAVACVRLRLGELDTEHRRRLIALSFSAGSRRGRAGI